MKNLNTILFLILSINLLVLSCKVNKANSGEKGVDLQKSVISEAIENNFDDSDSLSIIPNKKKNLFLYLSEKKATAVNPVNNINFFIYDKSKNEIIYSNKFSNASIKWHNNGQLILTRYYGIINSKDGDNIKYYIIDLNSKQIDEVKKDKTKI